MASSALGKLAASIILDTSEWTVGTEKAKYIAAQTATSIDKSFKDVEKSVASTVGGIAAALAAGFSVSALKDAFDSLVRMRGELERISVVTGASVQGLSVIGQAARLAGGDIGTAEMALVKLTKGLSASNADTKDTSLALQYLGVSARDAFGQIRDPGDIMLDVAKKMGGIHDGANKTALALALFGKSGAEMLPTLRAIAENGDLVAKVTDQQAQQARAYEQSIVRLNAAMSATKNLILGEFIPPMTALVQVVTTATTGTDSLSSSVKGMSQRGELRTFAQDAGYALAALIDYVRLTKDVIFAMGASLITTGANAVQLATQILPIGWAFRSIANAWGDVSKQAADAAWAKALDSITTKTRDAYEMQLKLNQAISDAASGKFDDQVSRAAAQTREKPFKGTDHGARENAFKAENAALDQQIAKLRGVGEMEAFLSKLQEDRYSKLTAYQREVLIGKEAEIIKLQTEKVARQEIIKSDTEMLLAQEKLRDIADNYAESLKAQVDQEQFGLDLMGKTNIEQQKAIEMHRLDLQLRQQLAALPQDEYGWDSKVAAALVAQNDEAKKKIALLIDTKAALTDQLKVWDTVSSAAGQFFGNLVTNGRSAFDQLRTSLKQFAADIIALFAKRYILQMVAGVTGSSAIGNAAASAGINTVAGSALDYLGLGSSAGSFMGAGALTGAGDFVGTGLAGMAGNVALAAGATDAFAATVAAAVPVIGWIVAIGAVLYSIYGQSGGGPKGGGSFNQLFNAAGAGLGSGGGRLFTPSTADPQMAQVGQSIATGYFATLQQLGGTARGNVGFGLGFDTDPNGTAANRISSGVSVNGRSIFSTTNRDIGRDSSQIQPELQLEASRMLLAALQSSNLPAYLANVFNGLTASTATQAQINAALAQAGALKQIFDTVSANPMADAAKVMTASQNQYQSAVASNETTIRRLMAAYDGSSTAAQNLATATTSYYNAQVQLLASIGQVKLAIGDMFQSTYRTIATAGLSGQDKYNFLQQDASRLQAQALSSTDPATIQRIAQMINQDITEAFGLLTPEQQAAQRGTFLTQAQATEAAIGARLDSIARSTAATMQATLDQIKAIITANADSQTAAAATQQQAANTQLTAARMPLLLRLDLNTGTVAVVNGG